MRFTKRIFSIILIAIFIIQGYVIDNISFALSDIQIAPSKLRIEAINTTESSIGYNEYDGYYVDLKWDVNFPASSTNGFVNLYAQEIGKPYKGSKSRTIIQKDILESQNNQFRVKNLKPGTMYYFDVTAYNTTENGSSSYTSSESIPSNRVKVLTNITLEGYSYGINQINIEWDDVWDSGKRIDYKLLISETESFTNTPPIYISQSNIGENKPIAVNEATGKLKYIYTVSDPGRVYYMKIVPDIYSSETKFNLESNTITVSSFILVRTSKLSTTQDGTIWRLEWSPVVTGLSDSSIKTIYQIYKGVLGSSDLSQYMAAVNSTNFYVTIPDDENKYYFTIIAKVTKNNEDLYPGIRIQSDKVFITEQEAASQPTVPEFVDKFEKVEGDVIISYDDELRSTSATLLWRIPKKGNNALDSDIMYDIWLISNPNLIDSPLDSSKIATNLKMSESNQVLNDVNIVGYKYTISNLTANSTYYVKIVAKKNYLEYIDASLQNVVISSDPSIKIVITPTEGFIEQPLVPAKTAFKIKKDANGKELISDTTTTIEFKNLWYERYDIELKKWEYIRTEKTSENDNPDFVPLPSVIDNVYYRKVEYDSGVSIDVGCIKYEEGMLYNDLLNLEANKITNFPVTANDKTEDSSLNYPYAQDEKNKHNVDITLNGLQPNTKYIIWIRANRASAGRISGPSDPIIITTNLAESEAPEKPVIPEFSYSQCSDTYVDLGWELREGYKYYIKYSKNDDLNMATESITTKTSDMVNKGYLTIDGLDKSTVYYFWIQSESPSVEGVILKSEWSDSVPLKTLENLPPEVPNGFGIKNVDNAITKDTITFEWISEIDINYILDIADNVNLDNSKQIEVGSVSEYKVEGLISNKRYYARLYAFSKKKNLKSDPSNIVIARTSKSDDEYDYSGDIDDVISGDYIEKDLKVVNNKWNVKIVGINADRFIEHAQTDKVLDYKIELTPPTNANQINMQISAKVFKALGDLKENLTIKNSKYQFVLRPGVLTGDASLFGKTGDFNYDIEMKVITSPTQVKNLTIKDKTVSFNVAAVFGIEAIPIDSFKKPIKVMYQYDKADFYTQGKTFGFLFNAANSSWKKLETTANYEQTTGVGNVSFESGKSGIMTVAETGSDYFDDIYYHKYETTINNVAAVHDLKSVKDRLFEPDNIINIGDAVKISMDSMDLQYGNDFMVVASKSSLIDASDVNSATVYCNFNKAVRMVLRIYELKTGTSIGNANEKTKFINDNSIFITNDNDVKTTSYENIKRGEMLYLIEKIMAITGEL